MNSYIISQDPFKTPTNIALVTTAEFAYELYCSKKDEITRLKYECDMLIDKYFSEMQQAIIPSELTEDYINRMFSEESKDKKIRDTSRNMFLERFFTKDFLANNKVDFVSSFRLGYGGYAFGIVLAIGEYEYHIECPQPRNINRADERKILMGEVKYRVDRILKSKANDLAKIMKAVQFPTYDWQTCFTAIENIVNEDAKNKDK